MLGSERLQEAAGLLVHVRGLLVQPQRCREVAVDLGARARAAGLLAELL